ncbi:peptidase S8/S53 domain-containing protein [Xylaria telfairii]|nr:peptidase S8/S53 domain-containing protein [Xylaria telfairii]
MEDKRNAKVEGKRHLSRPTDAISNQATMTIRTAGKNAARQKNTRTNSKKEDDEGEQIIKQPEPSLATPSPSAKSTGHRGGEAEARTPSRTRYSLSRTDRNSVDPKNILTESRRQKKSSAVTTSSLQTPPSKKSSIPASPTSSFASTVQSVATVDSSCPTPTPSGQYRQATRVTNNEEPQSTTDDSEDSDDDSHENRTFDWRPHTPHDLPKVEKETAARLQKIFKNRLLFKEDHDRPVRIAILDSGIDEGHPDLERPRARKFQVDGPNITPIASKHEKSQLDRIKGYKDFCSENSKPMDCYGHGTQVAGIILRRAPRAELVIARVCQRNYAEPTRVARALRWAIKEKVDIINLSFGYQKFHQEIEDALKEATEHSILIFAATSNDGNHESRVAYPGRSEYTIGIYSCNDEGTRTSPAAQQPMVLEGNFATVGEGVLSLWPVALGGGYQAGSGTSFAVPVAVSMAALILAFVGQSTFEEKREKVIDSLTLRQIRRKWGMVRVLWDLSNTLPRDHRAIRATLFWHDYDGDDGLDSDKHAWRKLKRLLQR